MDEEIWMLREDWDYEGYGYPTVFDHKPTKQELMEHCRLNSRDATKLHDTYKCERSPAYELTKITFDENGVC